MMRTMNPTVHKPHPDQEPRVHPCRPGDAGVFHGDNDLAGGDSITIPGPLMSNKMQIDDLVYFIQRKSQECVQHVDEPEQKEAYFFWQIMELLCIRNGLGMVKNQDGWCLPLAQLLCSAKPQHENLNAVVKMGEKLDSEELTYEAHICYVVAMEELQTCQGSSFDLIGCDRQVLSCQQASQVWTC
ncbi:uncharacterized protein LOC128609072 isoform X2 [Ictalurus furcatus]|uniref:uncharacterized protein LOC128609072 isoform X2 n=1 Tax=Ictalurus furcatus TaxID=66913 RepID=UPI00234FDBC8|nr:uncharacterized protein LOC128609072 isoform X2 [Ictalurus furcatus]